VEASRIHPADPESLPTIASNSPSFHGSRGHHPNGQDRAQALLSTCRHRGARTRTIRLLERLGQWRAARDLCLVAHETPESEAERQQLRRLLPRLNRKLGIASGNTRELSAVDTFEVLLDPPTGFRSVEIVVRDFLAQQEGPPSSVHYVENGLINSLFGLLFWDAIFAPIPGAFFHDFQYGPADLGSGRFHERRRSQFAADADIVLWDAERQHVIRHAELHDACDYTPYEGQAIQGVPVMTFSRGECVWDRGQIFGAPGRGRPIKRTKPASE
jgi:hypothetical protein